jgi:sulfur-oxidizing protein SoxX
MRDNRPLAGLSRAAAFILGALVLATPAFAGGHDEGKELAFDRKKGNCLACHAIEGGAYGGNIGPPLLMMKARFPERAKLRAQIWDATANNADSAMPPFGKHKALNEAEIDKITDFIWSL